MPNDSVRDFAIYPYFDLQDSTTTLVLSSVRDQPLRLTSAIDGGIVASFPLIKASTEQYIAAHSLSFMPGGRHFVAGSDSQLSMFDISRPGQGPDTSALTATRRGGYQHHNPATSMKGIVSAVAVEPTTNLIAAGTFTRRVGLYEAPGLRCVSTFSLGGSAAERHIGGSGVTQLQWTTCGRYLYVFERSSDGAMVYDIRKTGQVVSYLSGRNASTNQRLRADLSIEVVQEVWAGGIDGCLRTWDGVHLKEGCVEPSTQWPLPCHGERCDNVSSAAVHPKGGVLAITCGQRNRDLDDAEPHPGLYLYSHEKAQNE